MTDAPNPTPRSPSAACPGWVRIATDPLTVRRAIAYASVVGPILIAINHGDAILAGEVSAIQLPKMALTVLVPYVVSTCSTVGAIRHLAKARRS